MSKLIRWTAEFQDDTLIRLNSISPYSYLTHPYPGSYVRIEGFTVYNRYISACSSTRDYEILAPNCAEEALAIFRKIRKEEEGQ